jgi:hypothetical protein
MNGRLLAERRRRGFNAGRWHLIRKRMCHATSAGNRQLDLLRGCCKPFSGDKHAPPVFKQAARWRPGSASKLLSCVFDAMFAGGRNQPCAMR